MARGRTRGGKSGGRAGRRGLDNQGNIIFYGDIDYLSLMNSELPNIIGSKKPIYEAYRVLPKTILNEGVFQNMINDGRIYEKESLNLNIDNHNLLWYLREYSDGYTFTKNIFNLEKGLFDQPENERDIYLFKKILQLIHIDETILKDYQLRKISTNDNLCHFQEIIDVTMHIHNSLNYRKYIIIRKNCDIVFSILNKMIFNFII